MNQLLTREDPDIYAYYDRFGNRYLILTNEDARRAWRRVRHMEVLARMSEVLGLCYCRF